MPPQIAKLAHDILDSPARVDIAPPKIAVDRIDQRVFFVGTKEKPALLENLLVDCDMDRVLVFTRTKRGADRVCRNLVQAGIAAVALHGNKAQNARVRALNAFRSGHVRILVATDIAARGIDVPNISHVVNYDLPNEPESYVHRVGRTARAGAGGAALAFCDQNERPYLQAIERLMRSPVSVGEHPLAFSLPPALGSRPQCKRATPPKKQSPAHRHPSGVQRTMLAPSKGQRAFPLQGI
jgi:ATP-dependent RNA helicase RhlE